MREEGEREEEEAKDLEEYLEEAALPLEEELVFESSAHTAASNCRTSPLEVQKSGVEGAGGGEITAAVRNDCATLASRRLDVHQKQQVSMPSVAVKRPLHTA